MPSTFLAWVMRTVGDRAGVQIEGREAKELSSFSLLTLTVVLENRTSLAAM